jgi:hypothetical protein
MCAHTDRPPSPRDLLAAIAAREPTGGGIAWRARAQACILAGCDYAAAPKGMGLRTAIKQVAKYRRGIKVVMRMKQDGALPPGGCAAQPSRPPRPTRRADYVASYENAQRTFRHHVAAPAAEPDGRCR